MAKNIVICLDGTSNEPESRPTNVARTFDIALKDRDRQVAYYDPGVGTMGDRGATTRFGQTLSRIGGLAFGHGIKDNIAEAYQYLMQVYEPEDRVFVFGFSRGAYTARAFTGLLRTVGLLERGADNLVPYAIKLYTGAPRSKSAKEKQDRYWEKVNRWRVMFCQPAFDPFGNPIQFLGVWDTVKSVGWFNIVGKFQQARWPFTRNVGGVAHGRHAISIDERRRYYSAYRFSDEALGDPERDLREVWFAGVHSEVGGGAEAPELANIALKWMLDEASDLGLELRPRKYSMQVGASQGKPQPSELALGRSKPAGWVWAVIGLGWNPRPVPAGALVHRSVRIRQEDAALGYRPPFTAVEYVDR